VVHNGVRQERAGFPAAAAHRDVVPIADDQVAQPSAAHLDRHGVGRPAGAPCGQDVEGEPIETRGELARGGRVAHAPDFAFHLDGLRLRAALGADHRLPPVGWLLGGGQQM